MKRLLKKYIPVRLWNSVRNGYYKTKESYFRYILGDYSQAGETPIIRQLLRKSNNDGGFFVEVGANDGKTVSNTFGLVKNGWSGLSVEANPNVFARLEKNLRKFPKVKTVCLAVAPERGVVKLFFGRNDPQGLLSTISTESSEWFEKHRSDSYVEVPGVPLTELLDEQESPLNPDLLIIDAEGMDYEILLTLDFNKYQPKLIVTEDYELKNEAKFKVLEFAGYNFARRVGCNTFWVRSN
jgi:FkbM family methyltransferase